MSEQNNSHTEHTAKHSHHEVGPWQIFVESDLLNVLILALAIVYLGNKFLPKMVDERKKQISKELESARKTKEEAEKKLKEIEDKCKNISSEIAQIKNEAEKTASSMQKRIEEETHVELDKLRSKVKREIDSAQEEAIQTIHSTASKVALKLAEETLTKLSNNPDVQDKLVESFLNELDSPSKN